jgi:RNA polymerase sigma-70 factor, ECF subfamily
VEADTSNRIVDEAKPTGGATAAVSLEAEADLLRRARAGQADAFSELVVRYQDRVYNLMVRMAGVDQAEELAQEVFLRAFEKLDRFRGESRFYTWIFRIAANLAISQRRRKRRIAFTSLTRRREGEDDRQADEATAELASRRTPAPDANLLAGERADRIAAALDELDEDFRVVVVLRDIEDMDYAEIGEVLHLPPGTVKSRLHRARKLLQDKLADLIGPER